MGSNGSTCRYDQSGCPGEIVAERMGGKSLWLDRMEDCFNDMLISPAPQIMVDAQKRHGSAFVSVSEEKLALFPCCYLHFYLRYEREINLGQRSALKRILEQDDSPGRQMILVVASISKVTAEGIISFHLTS